MGDVGFFMIGIAAGFRTVFKEVKRGIKEEESESGRDNKGNVG